MPTATRKKKDSSADGAKSPKKPSSKSVRGTRPVEERAETTTASLRVVPPFREEPEAFIPDPEKTHRRVPDDFAEYMGENFVSSVTGGNDVDADAQDEILPAEVGGPFVETDAATEFGSTMTKDDFSDEPTLPEAFPTATRSGVEPISTPALGKRR